MFLGFLIILILTFSILVIQKSANLPLCLGRISAILKSYVRCSIHKIGSRVGNFCQSRIYLRVKYHPFSKTLLALSLQDTLKDSVSRLQRLLLAGATFLVMTELQVQKSSMCAEHMDLITGSVLAIGPLFFLRFPISLVACNPPGYCLRRFV